MRFVDFLAGFGERRRMTAPGAVGVLRVAQPGGGAAHRFLVCSAIEAGAGGEAEQNLAGVEGDRDARQLIDAAALESTFGELDRDKPVEAATRAPVEIGIVRCDAFGEE